MDRGDPRCLQHGLHSQVEVRGVDSHKDIRRVLNESPGHTALDLEQAREMGHIHLDEVVEHAGFLFAAIDLAGFRSGSLNEGIQPTVKR